ncbi:MAG: NYN domain-containing protein [Candidatus Heimdallarchaeum aukensis]|uniref:NYN domain-containing protein n=1 Tax=Candidatus Heimdallarchaeum aukensis TaxID=2876573 RepID=A0A9Y1BJG7_9ARCH|nr:MAG: NYN domain-containing protein [Candidatus Heimdallarchaeum aukensis]
MSERIITLLRKDTRKISCFFEGTILQNLTNKQITEMIDEIKSIGSIRSAKIFFDVKLQSEQHRKFIHLGLRPIIVPSDVDLYMALDILDTLHFGEKDIVVVAVRDTQLLPVVIAARDKMEVMIITDNKDVAESFSNYSDYLLVLQ